MAWVWDQFAWQEARKEWTIKAMDACEGMPDPVESMKFIRYALRKALNSIEDHGGEEWPTAKDLREAIDAAEGDCGKEY